MMSVPHAPWWTRLFPTPAPPRVTLTSAREVAEREELRARAKALVRIVEEEARLYEVRQASNADDSPDAPDPSRRE